MTLEIVPFKEPPLLAGLAAKLPSVFFPTQKVERFFGFFAAHIRNKNRRRAYYKAACRFSDWCEGRGLLDSCTTRRSDVASLDEYQKVGI